MNEPQPIVPSSIDPVDAAIQAALTPDPLTPAPVAEKPVAVNVEAEKPVPTEERKARQYADAAEAKRRAARAEAEARKARQDFQAQQEALNKEKADIESLFSGVKGNKAALRKLMDRAGLTLDDIARTELELDEIAPTADSKAEQALEEARALRKQIEEEKQALLEEQKRSQSEKAYNHYIDKVREELAKDATDKFELIKETSSFNHVLDLCFQFIAANPNETQDLSPEDEAVLINHCAAKLEKSLEDRYGSQANIFNKSSKLKKKLGINSPSVTGSSEPIRNNDTATLAPEQIEILESLSQETTAMSRGNKFITNDSTVSSRPTTVRSSYQSDSDAELEALISALGGQKSVF